MSIAPESFYVAEQSQFVSNFVVLPFCVASMGVYLYHSVFNEFRSYKFGVILCITNYMTILSVTDLFWLPPRGNEFSYNAWLLYYLMENGYMLSPLKTWLFSAQYFQSASLLVEF